MTDPSQPISHDLAGSVQLEQVKILYSYTPIQVIGHFMTMGLVIIIFWSLVSHAILISFGAVMTLYVIARWILYQSFKSHVVTASEAKRWIWYRLVGAIWAGLIWGAAGFFLFLPGRLEHQLIILSLLAGLGGAAAISMAVDKKLFYAYFIISLIPIMVRMFFQGDIFHFIFGLVVLLYFATFLLFARNIHRSFVDSVYLRYELNQQKIEAERANIAKSKFLAAASHDLRQPLHALTLFGSALQKRIHLPEDRQIVDKMNLSIAALESLFASLLDISKLDAGTLQPEIHSFYLNRLMERLQDDYSHQAKEKGLAWNYQSCDSVVLTDATMLERILRNLIVNAIRYTDAGEITLRCISGTEALRIEVCDTGPGIAPQHLDEIFEEFTQLDNPERDRNKGMGLGLAIVKRTTELLGHKMDVSSEVGKGSIFAVEVPYGDPTALSTAISSGQNGSADLDNLYVVLVDDERAVCEGMQMLLEGWGCRVASFTAPDEALQQLSPQRPPDAILVDYRLRDGKTGVEAIHSMHEFFQREDIPALIITGDTAPDRLREAQASGFHLLHKPVAPAKLRRFLQHV